MVPIFPCTLTEETLLPPVRIAVEQLRSSITSLSRTNFTSDTEKVVSSIAQISAAVPRDHPDPHVARFLYYNRYRPMIAALCSLVTSAKLAASDWSPEAQIKKMERDATEVLSKAEAYCEYARVTALVVPKRVKPFFMSPREGDGRLGGGWTSNLGRAGTQNPDHLEQLLGEIDLERDAIERCIKAMGLPGTGSSRARKNSLVIVDDHLIIPFMLIAIQVFTPLTRLIIGNTECGGQVDRIGGSSRSDFPHGIRRRPSIAHNR